MKLSHIPLRLATGAFILNSGMGKMKLDTDSAAGMKQMAANALPQVEQLESEQFGKYLAYAETALGAALLAPFVPSRLAGLGLTAFSAGLVAMYLRTPGMTQEDGVRPSQEGTAIAKDVWMLGIGLSMVLDTRTKASKD
ncbi:hypothetical protein [Arthrobacter pigmenti]